jgi:hypothetical protein
MIEIVDYKPEHLAGIVLRECHDGERPVEIRGHAITVMSDGTPLAIIGWHFITPFVIQSWGLLSRDVSAKRFSFHKTMKLFLDWAFEEHKLQRAQISVRVGYKAGWDWAKSLGFGCEAVMKKYGPDGSDYWLFARVKP